MKKRLLMLVLFFLWGGPLWAQPSIQANLDRETITTGDTLRLTITIKGGSALTTPEIPSRGNFEVVGRSTGNSIEIINGEMSVTSTFEYLLRPIHAGHFKIGPITTHIEGQTYSTGEIKVSVLEDTGTPQTPQAPLSPPGPPPGFTPPGSPPSGGGNPDTFVTAELDKTQAYVGEQILFTFRLYSAVSLADAQLKLPEFKEFISEELIKERQFETQIQGRRYAVNEWRLALFPTQAGKLNTGSASVTASVPIPIYPNDTFNDPFFQRFAMRHQLEEKTFATKNLEIEVKPLPTPPPDFSGLVGDFSLDSKLDEDRLMTGETLHYSITLQGKGNIREGTLPKVADTPYFKVYPATPKVEEDKTLAGLGGKKTFSYAIVASRPGNATLGPFVTSYFNPKNESYEELKVPAHSIQITGSRSQESLVSAGIEPKGGGLLSGEGAPLGLKGIRGPATVLTHALPGPMGAWFWWAVLLLPPGIYFGVIFIEFHRRRRDAQAEDRKRSRAFRNAKQGLGQIAWEKGVEAYADAGMVLRNYLSDAFLIKAGALTPGEVENLLEEKGISADTIRRMVYLLESVDSWKYGGGSQSLPGGTQLRDEMVDLLREVEKAL